MNMFSIIKNKTINTIETFFIFYNIPFGNNIITLNNALFYCEVIGCNKIILKKYNIFQKNILIKNFI